VDGQPDLTATAAYEPEPAAAAAARRFVRETLRRWHVGNGSSRLIDDTVLLTSELVTNAVVHAGTQIQVTCRLDGSEVEVSVRDRHPARMIPELPSRPDAPDGTAVPAGTGVPVAAVEADPRTSGRGLLLPAALASSWGVTYARAAKAVWFRIGSGGNGDGGNNGNGRGASADEGAQTAVMHHATPFGEEKGAGWAEPIPDVGRLGYDELLRHTVETARDAVAADAAYALVADEDGELRMRAGAGIGPPELLAGLARPAVQGVADPSGLGLPAVYDDLGQAGPDLPLPRGPAARSLVTVPFLAEGRVTGVLAVAAAEPDRFSNDDAAQLQRVADRVALSLERARLAELERARRGRISFLAEASDLLAGTLDQEKTIALAAQLVVPRLASWCAVYLVDETGTAKPAYVWHSDEAQADALSDLLAQLPPPEITGRGGSRRWSLAMVSPAMVPPGGSSLPSDAVWCFPLAARGRALGAFVIGRPRGDRFPREAIEMAEDLGRRAALALDNARLYSQQRQTSQALQRSLLPPDVPHVPGVDLAVVHEAAGEGNEVGGDFYDVFQAGEGRWRFAIGDVCGTGPEAAAVTGLARYTMRILAREGRSLPEVLDRLNRLILDEGPRSRFLTVVHGEIMVGPGDPAAPAGLGAAGAAGRRTPSGRPFGRRRGSPKATKGPGELPVPSLAALSARVSLVCAGHPLPLLLQQSGRAVPAASPQPLLGVLDEVAFSAETVELSAGDLLLCVTDGVTERRDADGRLLDDDDGLRELFGECRGLNARAVAARIQRAVHEYAPQPPTDDMALIVLRALPQ
jgi:serine phosphatase RsbU (regulator of sigma subunit)/anti-sigma regulatory factor (Ser/Thr protein kinase)